MKNKKVLALLISLVLIVAVALPGTLAVSSDQDAVNSDFTVTDETPAPETPEQPADPENPEQPVEPETPEQPAPEQETPEQPEQPADPENPEQETPETPAEETVVINHIETCLEGCTGEECTCVCHLYEKIMAAETLDEIWTLFDEASEETINALTDEMKAKIDEKIVELEPAPAPAIIVEETTDEIVPSEIVHPTVNFTWVAPFGAPVTGGRG